MVTREELFEAVWTEPMITLSSRYGVSGSYLARVCDSLNVATICDSVNFDVRMEPPGWERCQKVLVMRCLSAGGAYVYALLGINTCRNA